MQTQSRFFDDLAQLMTSAMGAAQGVRQEAELAVRHRLERLMADYDFVSREEFDAVRDMAVKAREENAALSARIEALEDSLTELAAMPQAPNAQTIAPSPEFGGNRAGIRPMRHAAAQGGRRSKRRGTPRKKRY